MIAFFSRRGIEALAVGTIEELLRELAMTPTPFLLLSVNFPHPKVDSLPALLSQKFSTQCLAFAELTDRKTEGRLANIKARQVIYGAVSGLTVLTRIKQVEQENTKLQPTQTKNLEPKALSPSPALSPEPSSAPAPAPAPAQTVTQANSPANSDVKFVPGQPPPPDSLVVKGKSNNDYPLAGRFAGATSSENGLPSASPGATAAAQIMAKLGWSASTDTMRRLSFLECACTAIKELHPKAEISLNPLKEIRSTGLLMVCDEYKSNFVLVASEAEPHPSAGVLSLTKALLQQAREIGLETPDSYSKTLMFQKVTVPVDTFSSAEFSITTRFNSTAFGLSYIELPTREPLIQPKSNEFAEIKIIEIAKNLPLTFDVFVFLPRNKKYLRFSSAGSEFAENKRNRLLAAGRNTVLVKTQEVPYFREHSIWAQIRSGIADRRD